MRRIAILGSTGSIGLNTLDIIRSFPQEFRVCALTTNSNIDILCQQIREFRPAFVCVGDKRAAAGLKGRVDFKDTRLFLGEEGLVEMVRDKSIEAVVLAISGSGALLPLLEVIKEGKDIALANKEALVMAGPLIMSAAKKKKANIIPVDSEQSAIWQCLDGGDKKEIRKIYLTASGGPLRRTAKKDLRHVLIKEVLRHPRWRMGRKISVDSATLMNKGLELLETMFLFGVSHEKIEIIVHPQAIIHSMIEFIDGVIMAQLSITDMRIPIQYAISYPKRLSNILPSVDFCKLKSLDFEKPDLIRFPCLGLAYWAAQSGGTAPCVLNAANETSVAEFLNGRLKFLAIPKVIEKVLSKHRNIKSPNLNEILATHRWAREEAVKIIDRLN